MASAQVLYGVGVRDAIGSQDLAQMKATLENAEKLIREQGDLHVAVLDLREAIQRLEGNTKS